MSAALSVRPHRAAQSVHVRIAGRDAAIATFAPDGRGAVDVSCYVAGGHQPVGVRDEIMAAVFAAPEVRACQRLRVTIPLGDVALLRAIQDHCPELQARAAGSTCLIDATMH